MPEGQLEVKIARFRGNRPHIEYDGPIVKRFRICRMMLCGNIAVAGSQRMWRSGRIIEVDKRGRV